MTLLEKIKGQLIVSCQVEEGFSLNIPHHLAAFVSTTVMGRAVAIRASDPENIRAMQEVLKVPIIGIYKKDYAGFDVRITPTISEVEALIALDIDMIALDATKRSRPDGQSLEQLVSVIRKRSNVLLMADVSNLEEGIKAEELGFDAIGTTLSGYTDYTPERFGVDIQLISELARTVNVPIIAEGRINTPDDVRVALEVAAHAVVVVSMITRPHMITERFMAATKQYDESECVVVVDISGTKIAFGIVDGQGEILLKKRIATPNHGGSAIAQEVILEH